MTNTAINTGAGGAAARRVAAPAAPFKSYIVKVSDTGEGPETSVKLRRWLKWSLRLFGLRCINITETPAEGEAKL